MATLRAYYNAVRAFSFPASVVPAMLGITASYILHRHDTTFTFSLVHAVLTLLGCVAIHSVSNLANDYFDYKSGLDSTENFGWKNPLLNGSLSISELRGELLFFFVLALSIGIYFIVQIGLPILLLVLFGAISAFGYTMPPLKLKHRGLGDIQVAISFGLLMCIGAYIVQSHTHCTIQSLTTVVLLSLPQCFHIVAILHANNHRDRESDILHNVHTLATRLTYAQSVRFQYLMVYGSYAMLMLVWFVSLFGIGYQLAPTILLPLLTLLHAKRVAQNIHRRESPGTAAHKLLVAEAARLQLLSGLLLLIGLVISIPINPTIK